MPGFFPQSILLITSPFFIGDEETQQMFVWRWWDVSLLMVWLSHVHFACVCSNTSEHVKGMCDATTTVWHTHTQPAYDYSVRKLWIESEASYHGEPHNVHSSVRHTHTQWLSYDVLSCFVVFILGVFSVSHRSERNSLTISVIIVLMWSVRRLILCGTKQQQFWWTTPEIWPKTSWRWRRCQSSERTGQWF